LDVVFYYLLLAKFTEKIANANEENCEEQSAVFKFESLPKIFITAGLFVLREGDHKRWE
jgi:hypothetical protein